MFWCFLLESLEVLSDYQWSPNDRDKLSSTAIIIASDGRHILWFAFCIDYVILCMALCSQ